MRPRHVLTAGAAALLLVATVLVGPAHAAVLTYSGSIEPNGTPTMPVVFITTPECTGQGDTEVAYVEHPIVATASGTTTFDLTELSGDMTIYLMQAGWDPAAAFPFCLAASNSGTDKSITYDVEAGLGYVVVIIDDAFDQPGGSYELVIDGPVRDPYAEVTPPTRPPGSIPAPTTTVPEPTLPPTTAPPTTAPPTTGTTPTTAPPTTGTPTTAAPTTQPTPTTARPGGVTTAPPAQPMAGAPSYTG